MREAGLWINPDYIRRQVKRLTKQSAKNIITLSDTTKLQPLILCHADAVWLSFPIKCRNLISLSCVLIYVSFLWLIHHHHIFLFHFIYSCNNHTIGLGELQCNLMRYGIKKPGKCSFALILELKLNNMPQRYAHDRFFKSSSLQDPKVLLTMS